MRAERPSSLVAFPPPSAVKHTLWRRHRKGPGSGGGSGLARQSSRPRCCTCEVGSPPQRPRKNHTQEWHHDERATLPCGTEEHDDPRRHGRSPPSLPNTPSLHSSSFRLLRRTHSCLRDPIDSIFCVLLNLGNAKRERKSEIGELREGHQGKVRKEGRRGEEKSRRREKEKDRNKGRNNGQE